MTRGMDDIMGRLACHRSTLSAVEPDGQVRHPQHALGTMAPAKWPKSAQICHGGDDLDGPAGPPLHSQHMTFGGSPLSTEPMRCAGAWGVGLQPNQDAMCAAIELNALSAASE